MSGARRSGARGATVVVVGDALLDVDVSGTASRLRPGEAAPVLEKQVEAPRPGGAALAACLLGGVRRVVLVTALGRDDEAAQQLRDVLDPRIELVDVGRAHTVVKTRIRAAGRTLVRLDRGQDGEPGFGSCPPEVLRAAFAGASAVLASDHGLGVLQLVAVRRILADLAGDISLVWDPHPRGIRPVPGVTVATPNEEEAAVWSHLPGGSLEASVRQARTLAGNWEADLVAVTRGAAGLTVVGREGPPRVIPARKVTTGDAWGAGDAFAAALTALLADGWPADEALAQACVRAGDFVRMGAWRPEREREVPAEDGLRSGSREPGTTQGTAHVLPARTPSHEPWLALPSPRVSVADAGSAVPEPPPAGSRVVTPLGWTGSGSERIQDDGGARPEDVTESRKGRTADAVVASVRAAGGTVVLAGGCFDLLHAGHVAYLEAARRLGDCLVVAVNSDASVRMLKGPNRPLVPAQDRMRVLEGLRCVDAVEVFEETTPARVIERLRPDIFAKGGEQSEATIPESSLVRSLGGEVVLVPMLTGRSSTRLVAAARGDAPNEPTEQLRTQPQTA